VILSDKGFLGKCRIPSGNISEIGASKARSFSMMALVKPMRE